MKKILLFICVLCSASSFAQDVRNDTLQYYFFRQKKTDYILSTVERFKKDRTAVYTEINRVSNSAFLLGMFIISHYDLDSEEKISGLLIDWGASSPFTMTLDELNEFLPILDKVKSRFDQEDEYESNIAKSSCAKNIRGLKLTFTIKKGRISTILATRNYSKKARISLSKRAFRKFREFLIEARDILDQEKNK